MTDVFWLGVAVGAGGFAVIAAIASWFRNRLSEFLNPTKKQRTVQSTDRTPWQVLKTSIWALFQIVIVLAGLLFIAAQVI